MCGLPPGSQLVTTKTFYRSEYLEKEGRSGIAGCVCDAGTSFFSEMLAPTKSFSGHIEKIVQFLGYPCFYMFFGAFSTLKRKTPKHVHF